IFTFFTSMQCILLFICIYHVLFIRHPSVAPVLVKTIIQRLQRIQNAPQLLAHHSLHFLCRFSRCSYSQDASIVVQTLL
ncbi:hypothetical protein PENTCL1PPCAC_19885, partial [Pristionchus entomophagus]